MMGECCSPAADSSNKSRMRGVRWSVPVLIPLLVIGQAVTPAAGQEGATARKVQPFNLRVVGPDGKPVTGAAVEMRLDPPLLTGKQIRRGEATHIGGRTKFKADEEGRIELDLPASPKLFVLEIKQPGFGPYWAEWRTSDHLEIVPPELVAELDEGWTVGGVVVDRGGNPVEGAKVNPSIKFKKRPGDDDELWLGDEMVTDADGKWKFAYVPASMRDVHVTVNHADFKAERRSLSRSEFGLEPDQEPSAKIPLSRGITVVGKVTDERGNPIANALVRTRFTNEDRATTTGRDGTYFLSGCEPRMMRIVVSAKGRAMELQNVCVEPEMPPVDFILKPGGHIRVVVLDESGKPIPRTRIFFQRWRGHIEYFEFDHVDEYTGGDGVWEWNECAARRIQGRYLPRQWDAVARAAPRRARGGVCLPPAASPRHFRQGH